MNRFALATALGTVALARVAHADVPNPDQTYVQSVKHAGTGCPDGSVAHSLSQDAQSLTLLFDDYTVEAGGPDPGVPASAAKACSVDVTMHVPAGWSYAMFTVDYRGYARLDPEAFGQHQTSYSFQGLGPLARTVAVGTNRIDGPYDNDYSFRQQAPTEALVWSACSGAARDLLVTTNVSVTGTATARGLVTVDSIDGELTQQYGLQWRRCQDLAAGNFLDGLFRDLLGRAPSAAELANWMSGYQARNNDRPWTAQQFVNAPERRSVETRSYFSLFLNRAPSPTGFNNWLAWFAAGNSTIDAQAAFLAADEFFALQGKDVHRFITAVYAKMLARAPSAADLTAWDAYLANHSRNDAVRAVLTSNENRTRLVRAWYQKYLRRASSAAEESAVLPTMLGAGQHEKALAALLASNEYYLLTH